MLVRLAFTGVPGLLHESECDMVKLKYFKSRLIYFQEPE